MDTREFVNVTPGRLYLQSGASFHSSQWGFDSGRAMWLTHPSTPRSQWPQRDDPWPDYPKMFLTDVADEEDESGLILLTGTFRGLKNTGVSGAIRKERALASSDVSLFTLPALQTGVKTQLVAPVPKPKVTREYVTTTKPTLSGVGGNISGTLPAYLNVTLPTFSITFTPDPDQPQTHNYRPGWKMDSRSWEEVAGAVWHVREAFSYYWDLAV